MEELVFLGIHHLLCLATGNALFLIKNSITDLNFGFMRNLKGLAVKPSQRDQNVELRSFPLLCVIYLKIDKKSILSSSSKALPVFQKNDRLPIRHAWESVECRFSSGLFEKPSRTRQDVFFGLMLSASSCTKMNLPQPIVFLLFLVSHTTTLHEKQSKMSRLQFQCLTSKHTFWDIMTGWMKKRWRELPDMLTNMFISVHHFQHQEKNK